MWDCIIVAADENVQVQCVMCEDRAGTEEEKAWPEFWPQPCLVSEHVWPFGKLLTASGLTFPISKVTSGALPAAGDMMFKEALRRSLQGSETV